MTNDIYGVECQCGFNHMFQIDGIDCKCGEVHEAHLHTDAGDVFFDIKCNKKNCGKALRFVLIKGRE
jgi:hypothetical protein